MIENKQEVSKDLEKALQTLEQAKQRVTNEKKSITDNRARPSRARKKFNVNFIVNTNTFLYN